jgi:nitrate reductase NapE component
MAGRNTKRQKQTQAEDQAVTRRQKISQYLFAIFALFVILSMVVTAFANY